jgi:hypothetical protein
MSILAHKLRKTPQQQVGGGGGIEYIASTSNSTTFNSSSFTIDKPTGTIEDDLMIACLCSSTTSGNFTAPSGWTEVLDTTSRGVFYKVAGASEDSSYTFTRSASSRHDGFILTFRGATYDTVGSLSGSSNPTVASSITVSANDSFVICFASSNLVYNVTATYPEGWDKKAEDTDGSSPTGAVATKMFDSGSTGTVSVSFNSGYSFFRSVLISINPI